MAHIEIHLDWDELPPDGTVFGVGHVVVPENAPSMDQREGIDFCPACGREYAGRVASEVPNPPCFECIEYDPVVIAPGVEQPGAEFFGPQAADAAKSFNWEDQPVHPAIARAIELGRLHGQNAVVQHEMLMLDERGGWPPDERAAYYQRVWQGRKDHDPKVLGNLPQPDLSGEWAGWSSRDLEIECYNAMPDPKRPTDIDPMISDIADAYEDAFREGADEQLDKSIAETLGEHPEHLLPINYSMTQADVDALFELIPGAKDALQGMDIANTYPLWDNVVLMFDGVGDPFTRDQVRERVAVALRVICYGEFVDLDEWIGQRRSARDDVRAAMDHLRAAHHGADSTSQVDIEQALDTLTFVERFLDR